TWSIAVDNRPGLQRIFVGNDSGVFASADQGITWTPYKTGLPNVQVSTLALDPVTNILAAGTLGRGLYEIQVSPTINVQLLVPATGIVAGQALINIPVAQFNDLVATAPISNYVATINWGDGHVTPSATLSAAPGGSIIVSGSNTYATKGTYIITVSIQESNG